MASKKDGPNTRLRVRDRSVPRHRGEERQPAQELDPSAGEYFPSFDDERYVSTITGAVQSVLKTDLDAQLHETTAKLTDALDAMEERHETTRRDFQAQARERDSELSELLRQLVISNQNAAEQASRTERDRLEAEGRMRAENRERWEEEKADRNRREALKAIPAPTPMSKDQDIADYLELLRAIWSADRSQRLLEPVTYSHS